jgi:hypothetical protein
MMKQLSKEVLKTLNRSPQKKAALQKERLIKIAKQQEQGKARKGIKIW